MNLEYTIKYTAVNSYENSANAALWQFLIIPQNNDTQELVSDRFTNNLGVPVEHSINGYNFRTYRLRPRRTIIEEIQFNAEFKLIKKVENVFDRIANIDIETETNLLKSLAFRADNDMFLMETKRTKLPSEPGFQYDPSETIFKNLQNLNSWIYSEFDFDAEATHVHTQLDEILKYRRGVCQDFTHLFIAICRKFGIPARYVSGYLHQGNGYFGDSQMHAWIECNLPRTGWIGFDPTNNLIAAENHIKVSHGKDYSDCAPLRGIDFSTGSNETEYSVQVAAQQ